MALTAVAAAIAVMDAKYYYFWRPFTAIRNGDIDDNPTTERHNRALQIVSRARNPAIRFPDADWSAIAVIRA
jgi:hypothetical protein